LAGGAGHGVCFLDGFMSLHKNDMNVVFQIKMGRTPIGKKALDESALTV